MYIDKLDNIIHKYNNKKHRTIKMKPIDVTGNTYINFGKEVNDNDPKFKVGDHVRISKYKNIFAKGYTPNWFEEVFVIKKIRNTVPWTHVIDDTNGEKSTGEFHEKELQKIDQQEFRIEKVIKKEGDKLYVKWKGYDNSFNSWIDKKDLDFEDKINKIDKKIPDISSLVKKTDFNTKITETEGKLPSITGLATNSELTAVKNKIPDVNSLVKRTNFNTKLLK